MTTGRSGMALRRSCILTDGTSVIDILLTNGEVLRTYWQRGGPMPICLRGPDVISREQADDHPLMKWEQFSDWFAR